VAEQAGPAAAKERQPPAEPPNSALPGVRGAQRLFESLIVAVATSTGIYLVGSVYLEAYYGRMSMDVSALDFAPPYIALQSTHVLTNLLRYPLILLTFYLFYRVFLSRAQWWRAWYDVIHQRFGRLFLLVVNLLIVSPLLNAAIRAGSDRGVIYSSSILSEVSELMQLFGLALFVYILWLSFSPRTIILTEIRQHKIIPVALLAILYFLDALIATANSAQIDAELLMTGASDTSTAVTFTLADGVRTTLPDAELILITTRNGNYYVVQRQPYPPSGRPMTYVVPSDAVDMARLQRINATQSKSEGITIIIGEDTTPGVR
jgi:hypothetical protein